MIGQIECQNEIIKSINSLIAKGNDFCVDCKEAHLCNGCRLNAMLTALTQFVTEY